MVEVQIPGRSSGIASVEAIDARSSADIWAVGEHGLTGAHGRYVYAIHWNGERWTLANLPHRRGELAGIVALHHQAWTVGNAGTSGLGHPLTFHRSRDGWERVAIAPTGFSENLLTSVSAAAAADVWVVGTGGPGLGESGTLEHWNGARWSLHHAVKFAAYAIAAQSSANVMAVGEGNSTAWREGRIWKTVPTAPPPSGYPRGILYDVAWDSPSTAWAVGGAGDGGAQERYRAYVERWNGTKWTLAEDVAFGSNSYPFLDGVASAGGITWAVGSRYPKGGFVERYC